MTDPVSVRLLIHGQFDEAVFADWICHRALVLALSGSVRTRSDTCLEVHATGNPILVDALEVTCSLGPYGAQVDEVEVTNVNTSSDQGRFVRI